jgi:hypothetical protein
MPGPGLNIYHDLDYTVLSEIGISDKHCMFIEITKVK